MSAEDGIARLLKAEDEAEELIKQARAERVALLRNAESEAAKEVSKIRQEMEVAYQK